MAKDSWQIHGFLGQQMGPEGITSSTRHPPVGISITTWCQGYKSLLWV